MKRIAGAIASLAVGSIVLTGCMVATPNVDQIGLHYSGGPFSGHSFIECDPSGQRQVHGAGDQEFYYPTGQRTFRFGPTPGSEAAAIEVVSRDNIELTVTGIVTFNLDTSCDTLRKFHEQIGYKKGAYMDQDGTLSDGWVSTLRDYMGNALQQAINNATQAIGYKELYNNPETKIAWEKAVVDNVPTLIKTLSGGDWFKNIGITIQKPTLPQDVLNALAAAQVAVAANDAQREKNKQIDTELISLKKLTEVLGPYGAILYQAIKNGQITVLPLPAGSNINVTPAVK